ncbi:TetR family transcriptional regulator [Streptomyces capitiformicae]|uniref:TetR family transcriptional regulator n=1 Tax=Streptomyces capitiformicae TaxID=2014920 RepID=A0A919GHC0_9ACTN|nr:TetR family transcriptional regulator [Streptomyces capitiformicae]GHH83986.1 TetR family transcriptional regulator [Streptomyces capitiformicae]
MAPSTTEPLTAERILVATEEVLRRHGPAKATVVDVARALGVSHGSVYRHFRTKAALREAVTKRWLDRTTQMLHDITRVRSETPPQLLRHWLGALFTAKRHKAGDDPELFATYQVLLGETSAVVEEHIADLVGQLVYILERGIREADFTGVTLATVDTTARAVFHATARFHDPAYAPVWQQPDIEDQFTAVVDLVVRGLRA